jgi:hypothetical protein
MASGGLSGGGGLASASHRTAGPGSAVSGTSDSPFDSPAGSTAAAGGPPDESLENDSSDARLSLVAESPEGEASATEAPGQSTSRVAGDSAVGGNGGPAGSSRVTSPEEGTVSNSGDSPFDAAVRPKVGLVGRGDDAPVTATPTAATTTATTAATSTATTTTTTTSSSSAAASAAGSSTPEASTPAAAAAAAAATVTHPVDLSAAGDDEFQCTMCKAFVLKFAEQVAATTPAPVNINCDAYNPTLRLVGACRDFWITYSTIVKQFPLHAQPYCVCVRTGLCTPIADTEKSCESSKPIAAAATTTAAAATGAAAAAEPEKDATVAAAAAEPQKEAAAAHPH